MKEKTTAELQKIFDNPALWDLAGSWMTAKAKAETLRESVDKIATEILKNEVTLYNDLDVELAGAPKKRITDPNEAYSSKDEKEFQRFTDLCDAATAKAGLRTPDMKPGYCPALVAEHDKVKIEWKILDALNEIYDTDSFNGIYGDLRKQAIEIFIKAAFNHPNNPRKS